jgi:hypothetical protein
VPVGVECRFRSAIRRVFLRDPRVFPRAPNIRTLRFEKEKRRGRQNRRLLIFFRAGFTHRRGYVSGGHVGEGLAARSPDRRLGDPRGVPGNPERDLKLVCGGRKGAIRVSSSRARRLANSQKIPKSRPKNRPRGKGSSRRAPLREPAPELSLALTPVFGSTFSLSSSKTKNVASFSPPEASESPGACPAGLPIVPRILTTIPCFAAMCAAATVTGEGHFSGFMLSSAMRCCTFG